MTATPNVTLQQKIIRALKSDPKKTTVLTVLVTAWGFMGVRAAMKQKDTPVNAAVQQSYAVSDNQHALTDTSGASNDKWLRGDIAPLSRNLFTVKLDNFPLDGTGDASAQKQPDEGFWDQLAKSMSSRADQKKERQALLDNLQHQASQLRLQSIVMGAKPRAVINGEMVGEGDVVAVGSEPTRTVFRVLKIESRRVIIEREGIKLEMQMN